MQPQYRKILIGGLIFLTLSTSAATTYFWQKSAHGQNAQKTNEVIQEAVVSENPEESVPDLSNRSESIDEVAGLTLFEKFQQRFTQQKTLTILLLGYGGAGHSGGLLADAIQVARVDFEQKNIQLISIPRDLWVSLPNGKQGKVNQIFSQGTGKQRIQSGGALSKEQIAVVVGAPIDYFVAIDFVGFKRIIGQEFKGLPVDVTIPLTDEWYPILGQEQNTCGKSSEEITTLMSQYSGFELEKQFPCRYQKIDIPMGKTVLHGDEALAYARSRHGSGGGDFDRGKRQQVILTALKQYALSTAALEQAPKLFTQFSKHLSTDMTLELVAFAVPFFSNLSEFRVINTNLNTTNVLQFGKSNSGQSIVMPKAGLDTWNEVHAFITTSRQ